jgi:hypothetical protein
LSKILILNNILELLLSFLCAFRKFYSFGFFSGWLCELVKTKCVKYAGLLSHETQQPAKQHVLFITIMLVNIIKIEGGLKEEKIMPTDIQHP